jgi:hypothetical protein
MDMEMTIQYEEHHPVDQVGFLGAGTRQIVINGAFAATYVATSPGRWIIQFPDFVQEHFRGSKWNLVDHVADVFEQEHDDDQR